MKVTITRTPYTMSSGSSQGTQDKVHITVEGDPENDTPVEVAKEYKEVVKELNKNLEDD